MTVTERSIWGKLSLETRRGGQGGSVWVTQVCLTRSDTEIKEGARSPRRLTPVQGTRAPQRTTKASCRSVLSRELCGKAARLRVVPRVR